mgnify:FL=1|jgi:uncharacterized paraquat-inducible protein A
MTAALALMCLLAVGAVVGRAVDALFPSVFDTLLGADDDVECVAAMTTPDTQNQTEARCPRCDGRNGHHGLVHVRHGNGGGHNEPCPETPRDANDG